MQTHTPSQAFQQHIEQNLIQDLLPELSLEFSLREVVLTSDSTCIFTTFDVATDSTFETSGSYLREGNKLLFPNPSVPYTSFLLLEEDDSVAYWCEYYFSRAYINQNSEEVYEGFQQFPCFILDELEPIDDYIQNYAQFEADDVLGVVIVNHVLTEQ